MQRGGGTEEEVLQPVRPWEIIKQQLQLDMAKSSYDTWVEPLRARLDGRTLVLIAPDVYGRDWVESRLLPTIQRLLFGWPQIKGVRASYEGADLPAEVEA